LKIGDQVEDASTNSRLVECFLSYILNIESKMNMLKSQRLQLTAKPQYIPSP